MVGEDAFGSVEEGNAQFVGTLDDIRILQGAGRSDDGGHTSLRGDFDAVGEGEETVGGHDGVFNGFLAAVFVVEFDDGLFDGADAVLFACADAKRAAVLHDDNAVGADGDVHIPRHENVLQLRGRRFDGADDMAERLAVGFGRLQIGDGADVRHERISNDKAAVGEHFERLVAGDIVADVFRQLLQITALEDADMLVEFRFWIGEDGDGFRLEIGGDDAFDERRHDFASGVGIDFHVEGDDGAESGACVAVAGFDVNVFQRVAWNSASRAAGIDVLHARAGGNVEEFDDVEGEGDVFQIGLGEAGFAVFEDLHVTDDAVAADGLVESGRLMRVGAVAEVIDFDEFAAENIGLFREVTDVL